MALGLSFRALRPRRPSSVAPLCLDRRRRAGSSVRLAFESLESRCLLSGSGFRLISEIGNNVRNPTEVTAGIDRLGIAATGSADAFSKPSLANDLSAFAIRSILNNQTTPSNFGAIQQRGGLDI